MLRVGLGMILLLAACAGPPAGLGKGVTLQIRASLGFKTQAISTDIDHLTYKLYQGVAPAGVLVGSTTSNSVSASISGVADGSYYLTAEAFSSADDSVSITDGGPAQSANTASVSGSAVTYSDLGNAFDVTVQLDPEPGGTLPVNMLDPGGATFSSALIKTDGTRIASYESNIPNFSYYSVDLGSYLLYGGYRMGTTSTVSRPAVNTATVGGGPGAYTVGFDNLDTKFTLPAISGQINAVVTVPPDLCMTSDPYGLVMDAAGNIYFTEAGANFIRKYDAALGAVTTIGGKTGPGGFSGDGGNALGAQFSVPMGLAVLGSDLYVADQGNDRIRKIDLTTNVVTTVAGGGSPGDGYGDGGAATSAQFDGPTGVAVDASGQIYVADFNNHTIRMVDTFGNISTVAGVKDTPGGGGDLGAATLANLSSPFDVAVNALGTEFYVADMGNLKIRKVTAGIIDTQAVVAGGPTSVQLDEGTGDLYVAEQFAHRINLVQGAVVTPLAGDGVAGDGPDGGLASAARLNAPYDVIRAPGGDVYVADKGNHRIRRISGGNLDTFLGTGQAGYSDGVILAMATDGSGNLYLADTWGNRILKYDTGGMTLSVFAGNSNGMTGGYSGDGGLAANAEFRQPLGLAVHGDYLYVSDFWNHRVRRIHLTTTIIDTFAGSGVPGGIGVPGGYSGDGGLATAAQLNMPYQLVVHNNQLHISDSANQVIRRVNLGNNLIETLNTTYPGGPTPSGGVSTMDGAGNIYFQGPDAIGMFDPSYAISLVAGTFMTPGNSGDGGAATGALLDNLADGLTTLMAGMAADPAGNLYVADANNARIRKIDTDGIITTLAGTGVAGIAGDGGAASAAQLRSPIVVHVDEQGTVYFSEFQYGIVRRID